AKRWAGGRGDAMLEAALVLTRVGHAVRIGTDPQLSCLRGRGAGERHGGQGFHEGRKHGRGVLGTSSKLTFCHLAGSRAISSSLRWGSKACLPYLGGCRNLPLLRV